jgi:hypothetical protein
LFVGKSGFDGGKPDLSFSDGELAVRSGRPESLVGGKKLFDGFKHLDGVLGLDLSNSFFDFRYFFFQGLNARESVSNIISGFHSSEKSNCEVLNKEI